jgi:hypothetical protein
MSALASGALCVVLATLFVFGGFGSVATPARAVQSSPSLGPGPGASAGPSLPLAQSGLQAPVGGGLGSSGTPRVGETFSASAGALGVPPHPGPPSPSAPPAYAGHYYTGTVYSGTNSTATNLSVTIQVPPDVPEGGGADFYYVLLSVWDSAGSYDQLGFANSFGTWGIAYSTSSYCAGSYSYSPLAFVLQQGDAYLFRMVIAEGFVHFSVSGVGSTFPLWRYSTYTGGDHFLISPYFACKGLAYYDYTDYEEVYETAGKRVPYDFAFSNNTADLAPVTAWTAWSTKSEGVALSGSSATIENEAYFLAFANGTDRVTVPSSSRPQTLPWNVSVSDLAPDSPVDLSLYSVPSGWSVALGSTSGSPPFTAGLNITVPASAPAGTYYVGLNATDTSASGFYSRAALVIQVGTPYLVSFSESGLPEGTPWSVALGNPWVVGSSDGPSLALSAPNGTHPYAVADVPGYHQTTLAYEGNVTIAGSSLTEPTMEFLEVEYSITFTETGLPIGVSWGAMVGNSSRTLETNGSEDTVRFSLPNGTYSYSISPTPDWTEQNLTASGVVVVNGTPVVEPLLIYRYSYPVGFSESGLPRGLVWAVSLSGLSQNTTTVPGTNSLAFDVPNGTYQYSIANLSGWTQTVLPSNGTIVVNGSPQNEPNLDYVETYLVTFSESGLPGSARFEVDLSGEIESLVVGTGSQELSYAETNGSYPFSIVSPSGWGASPAGGTLVVEGSATSEAILFGAPGWVNFQPSGLPCGTVWSVSMDGLVAAASCGNVLVAAPAGTYPFSVAAPGYAGDPGHGQLTVTAGTTIPVPIQFEPTVFSVAFYSEGLPNGTVWSVTMNGTTHTSNSTLVEIVFGDLSNGSYPFQVGTAVDYRASPTAGTVEVVGNFASYVVTFTHISPPPTDYTVTFTETGLPNGTAWSVGMDGLLQTSTTDADPFSVPNGTFVYGIAWVTGFAPAPGAGSLTVDGANQTVAVTFRPIATVTFVEEGLPATQLFGPGWTLELNGTVVHSHVADVVESLGPGPHPFLVTGPTGYSVTNISGAGVSAGELTVLGNTTVTVAFARGATYTLAITRTGLAIHQTWCVTLQGWGQCSGLATIRFLNLTPGTYPFAIDSPLAHRLVSEHAAPGVLVGCGTLLCVRVVHASTVALRFTYPYPVTFTEEGLPSGGMWSVTVAGATLSNSTGSPIVFPLTNGTHAYRVGSYSGYTVSRSSVYAIVRGGPASLILSFHARTASPRSGDLLPLALPGGPSAALGPLLVGFTGFPRRRH